MRWTRILSLQAAGGLGEGVLNLAVLLPYISMKPRMTLMMNGDFEMTGLLI